MGFCWTIRSHSFLVVHRVGCFRRNTSASNLFAIRERVFLWSGWKIICMDSMHRCWAIYLVCLRVYSAWLRKEGTGKAKLLGNEDICAFTAFTVYQGRLTSEVCDDKDGKLYSPLE